MEEKKRVATLCWNCSRSVHDKCSWAKRFVPVEGWDAEKTVLMVDARPTSSYLVKSCPLYKCDKDNKHKVSELDEVGANRLICDIIAFAIRDWKKANKALNGKHMKDESGIVISPDRAKYRIRETEAFFKSTWFGTLCDIDSERLILALRNNDVPEIKLLTKGGF